jgi:hypothetical protein
MPPKAKISMPTATAIARPQFLQQVHDVRSHRRFGDDQPSGYLGVGVAVGHQLQDRQFGVGQPFVRFSGHPPSTFLRTPPA